MCDLKKAAQQALLTRIQMSGAERARDSYIVVDAMLDTNALVSLAVLRDATMQSKCEDDRAALEQFVHPPRREWRSLSKEEFGYIYVRSATHEEFARAIEAKLRELNHD
jgi:hypothetical protein